MMHRIARMFLAALTFLGVLLMVPTAKPASAATVRYAKPAATGSGDCSSWANACTLQAALSSAASGDEIWVAGGTYKPHASDRTVSFVLKTGVKVFGGFAGTEGALEQRDIAANPTILSGDIGAQGNSSDNSYHVVVGSGTNSTAVLDGFTITGGNANGASDPDYSGGGMLIQGGSPTVKNVTFSGNSAIYGGGMISEYGSSPVLTNVTFSGNSAFINGGGMYSGEGSPTLTNVTFSGNSATNGGGGVYNALNSSPVLTNVIIANSTSGGDCINVETSTLDPTSSHNLIESIASTCGLNHGDQGNIIGQDPNLGPLADNGSAIQTHALLGYSPAIDAGDNTTCPAADQRGVARPQGAGCDIGAFERDTVVHYVRQAAAGNCTAWINACTLQTALNKAASGEEIWVAGGTYKPHASDRTVSFVLKNGVKVYGGFAGTGPTPSQRDIAAYPTILSGDIGSQGNISDNSYHVVVGSTNSTAVLDGVTITGGNANGPSDPDFSGGGMLKISGSLSLTNVTFSDNFASGFGGGMYNGDSLTLTNVTFSGNSAPSGGGMFNGGSSLLFTLTNVTFSGNSASSGGGMYDSGGNPTLTNVTFSDNTASTSGGGMYNDSSEPTLVNVIIANSTGGDCVNVGSTLDASHTLMEATGANACGLINGANFNIIGVDPQLDPLADNGGPTLTHALQHGSWAIDAGECSGGPATDQRGVARPQDDRCDIGAFERYSGIYYAKPAATGNCTAWAAACNLQAALNASAYGDQVWVKQGVYTPTARLDPADPRSVTFSLKNGVGVYGGFVGTENELGRRDITTNPTILSGDLAGNDNANVHPNEQTRAENAYHVVVGSGRDSSAVLDGFAITGGNANDSLSPDRLGGGMYNDSGNPTVKNVTFYNNTARYGGGMYNNVSSQPALENVTFSGNSAANNGGGMYNYFGSDPSLTNVTFSGNSATNYGGGMANDGSSDPRLTNVTFSGNSAPSGGGMHNSGNSHPKLTNVIIANSTNGGDCVNLSTTLDAASSHNLMEASGANACGLNNNNGNIIGQGPASLGPLADNGGATQTHALLPQSPAVNKGDNAACPAADQRGIPRPQGGACDIGAFEVVYLFLPMVQR